VSFRFSIIQVDSIFDEFNTLLEEDIDPEFFLLADGSHDSSLFGFSVLAILHHAGAMHRRSVSVLGR
jgi:hypothetical protein